MTQRGHHEPSNVELGTVARMPRLHPLTRYDQSATPVLGAAPATQPLHSGPDKDARLLKRRDGAEAAFLDS